MAGNTVRVLDADGLGDYDAMSSSLPFQLHTLERLLKSVSETHLLQFPLNIVLYGLCTSDDEELPSPPELFMGSRQGHAIFSDSRKGFKTGAKSKSRVPMTHALKAHF